MPYHFLCLQGDGIGPEILAATSQVLAAQRGAGVAMVLLIAGAGTWIFRHTQV